MTSRRKRNRPDKRAEAERLAVEDVRTGWPPGMLQDDSRELSRWLSNRPGAKRLADEAAQEIGARDE